MHTAEALKPLQLPCNRGGRWLPSPFATTRTLPNRACQSKPVLRLGHRLLRKVGLRVPVAMFSRLYHCVLQIISGVEFCVIFLLKVQFDTQAYTKQNTRPNISLVAISLCLRA